MSNVGWASAHAVFQFVSINANQDKNRAKPTPKTVATKLIINNH